MGLNFARKESVLDQGSVGLAVRRRRHAPHSKGDAEPLPINTYDSQLPR
jgi:hypothetical protein